METPYRTRRQPTTGKEALQMVLRKSASRLDLPPDSPSLLIVLPDQGISGGTTVLCEHANRLIRRGYNVVLIDNLLTGENRSRLDWFPDQRATVVPVNRLSFDCAVSAAMATHWTTASTVIDLPADRRLYFVQANENLFQSARFGGGQACGTDLLYGFRVPGHRPLACGVAEDGLRPDSRLRSQRRGREAVLPRRASGAQGPEIASAAGRGDRCARKGMADAFRAVGDLDCEVWCLSSNGRPQAGWRCDRFFHAVPKAELRQIYSSCDVLLKMSRSEGFFLPPMEMMACGGTVVTGKVNGYDEYIVHGRNGLVVEQGDVAAARASIQRLIDDRELLEQLKARGRETAAQWRWDRANDAFCKVLDRGTPASLRAAHRDIAVIADAGTSKDSLNHAELWQKAS